MDADQIAAAIATAMQPVIQQMQQRQPQPPQQPPQNQPAPFARSPALAHQNVINYSTSAGAKLYMTATEQLPMMFTLAEPNIRVLLNELKTCATEYGWEEMLTINTGDQAHPINHQLLEDHGRITQAEVMAHTLTYINQPMRLAQNNYQLYLCLTKSVDAEMKKRMANESEVYTAHVQQVAYFCGVSYLKLLLSKAEVDTQATASHIHRNLAHLDVFMKETANNDVAAFNEHVRDNIMSLSSRGEMSDDLMTNLFDGYLTCADKKFVEYIEHMKNAYDEGAELTAETLMTHAETKYAQRTGLDKDWNAPTEEQEDIVALKAKLEAAIANIKQRRNKFQAGDMNRNKASKKVAFKVDKGKAKGKKDRNFPGKMAFRNTKPKAREPTTKVVDGDTWHYCYHHGFWGRHKASECRMHNKKNEGGDTAAITASLAEVGITDFVLSEEQQE